MDALMKRNRYKIAGLQGCPYVDKVLDAGVPASAVVYDKSKKLIGTTIDGRRITSPSLIVGSLTDRSVVVVGSGKIVKFLKAELKKAGSDELNRVESEAIRLECEKRAVPDRVIDGTIKEYTKAIQSPELTPLIRAYIGLYIRNPKARKGITLSPTVHNLFRKYVLLIPENKKFVEFLVELVTNPLPKLNYVGQSSDAELDQLFEAKLHQLASVVDFTGRPWIFYHHVQRDVVMKNIFGSNLYDKEFWSVKFAKEILKTRASMKFGMGIRNTANDRSGPRQILGGFGRQTLRPGPGDTLVMSRGKVSVERGRRR